MEIPFLVKDSEASGVLVHAEAFKEDSAQLMIRAGYRADELLSPGQVLVFTEHDGAPIELCVSSATTNGHLELGPENASDFAVAFGFE